MSEFPYCVQIGTDIALELVGIGIIQRLGHGTHPIVHQIQKVVEGQPQIDGVCSGELGVYESWQEAELDRRVRSGTTSARDSLRARIVLLGAKGMGLDGLADVVGLYLDPPEKSIDLSCDEIGRAIATPTIRPVTTGLTIHVIADNYATHKHDKVRRARERLAEAQAPRINSIYL